MGDERERNNSGRYNDRIDPTAVLDVFDQRDDQARPLTAGDVVDEIGIARRTAHNKLNALVERGELETRKVGARGRVWWVPIRGDATQSRERRENRIEQNAVATTTKNDERQPDTTARRDDDLAGEGARDYIRDHGRATRADLVKQVDTDELPNTVDLDDAAAAVGAARDYIRDHGGATKADLVKQVMPDHPLGYDVDDALGKLDDDTRYRGAWWRKVVKPGLEADDDVEKPPKGGSVWEYDDEGADT